MKINFNDLIPDFKKSNYIGLGAAIIALILMFVPFGSIGISDDIKGLLSLAGAVSGGPQVASIMDETISMSFFSFSWMSGLVLGCLIVAIVCFLYNKTEIQKLISLIASAAALLFTLLGFLVGGTYISGYKALANKAIEVATKLGEGGGEVAMAKSYLDSYMDKAFAKHVGVGFILLLIVTAIMVASVFVMPLLTSAMNKPKVVYTQQVMPGQPQMYGQQVMPGQQAAPVQPQMYAQQAAPVQPQVYGQQVAPTQPQQPTNNQ